MRVLIVDDNALVRQALCASLRRHFDVQHASGIDGALELIAAKSVDLVITDVDLADAAGRDGLWLLDRVCGPGGILGFALTGHNLQHPRHLVLRKPTTLNDLRDAIRSLAG